ncbi:hypothetical protein AAES_42420 [Amazona aestiva]|uniref:Uncharacterized protein n=1 Tax=Amazona aestiva TaxID=12930 RepID=A0A0Q3MRR1_AMAAE|nr:hypothetical protein AAES_42420 [Amazona aestiva]
MCKDKKGYTLLHTAAASGQVEVVRHLLRLGVEKALHLLLKHSADVNARDKHWQTPLHVAAANRATKCVEAIVPLLSTVNVADRTGRTALHHAAHSLSLIHI